MSTQSRLSLFYIPLLVAVTLLALFFLAVALGWMGPPQGTGSDFCEASRNGWIRQPANTFSNFGFVVAGLLMAWQLSAGRFRARNLLTQNHFMAIFFSSLVVFLGPGSMAMHATETPLGGHLDMLSMYLVAAFMTAYGSMRYFGFGNALFTLVFVLVVMLCEYLGQTGIAVPVVGFMGSAAFAFFITLAILFEVLNTFHRKITFQKRWGIYGLVWLLTAFGIWNLSLDDGPICDPQSLIQGHAIWHLLCALATYCLFRFYASEEEGRSSPAAAV